MRKTGAILELFYISMIFMNDLTSLINAGIPPESPRKCSSIIKFILLH